MDNEEKKKENNVFNQIFQWLLNLSWFYNLVLL